MEIVVAVVLVAGLEGLLLCGLVLLSFEENGQHDGGATVGVERDTQLVE